VKSIVFAGGGRITSALAAGLRLGRYDRPMLVYDRNLRKLGEIKRRYRVEIERDLQAAVQAAELLVIAVRPDSVPELLREIGPQSRALSAVSLAAGVPLSKLRARLGPPVRWARAMPSPVCRSGRGLTAVTFERGFPAISRREVLRLFGRVGRVIEIPERHFDAFTVSYSSSHGYHALAVLAGAAQKLGLDRKTAITAAAHALADGIEYWRKGNLSLEALLEEAATPGGIAAAVTKAMDKAGYQRMVEQGLRAGLARARKNAKG
jgi:pyrroline-5-carboxylate reductase